MSFSISECEESKNFKIIRVSQNIKLLGGRMLTAVEFKTFLFIRNSVLVSVSDIISVLFINKFLH